MKIVVWNCNMSLARKLEPLRALAPEMLILQEVSQRDIENLPAPFKHWVSSNPHKGLAVVSFSHLDCRISDAYTDDLPWFLPVEIPALDLNILAVWACVKTSILRYVRVTHVAIEHYRSFITSRPTIMAGDFNSNPFWDKKQGKLTHTSLVTRLDALGLKSIYHEQNGLQHGGEPTPTWYMYRHPDKGYHIDYVFMPEPLISGSSLLVGHPDDWLALSDHMPLIVELTAYERLPEEVGVRSRSLRELGSSV